MELEQRLAGDVTIIKVTGDITLNKGGDVHLKDKVQSLLQQISEFEAIRSKW